ncbi:daunorubicin resistance ABC transporter, ATP-binding protein [Enterococcus faecalis 13-SD-W-01]|nr:daunorubicin resistance ABC transporter, ATP-binding protein [Enterococcus faecalis 13-SD-W-01]
MRKIIIEVKNLSKKYKKQAAVKDVSFNVFEGEIFSMLGSNGAGKTTTINMLNTLIKPTSGQVLINGHDLMQESEAIRKEISVTGQFASLEEELTGYENLSLLGKLNHIEPKKLKSRIAELLKEFDLENAANKLVKEYSGGMKRRLDIAASLLSSPKILFLDEPTTGIDPQNRIKLWQMIKKIAKEEKMTIFLTTQYLEEAEYLADFVVIMNNGSIIEKGTVQRLKNSYEQQTVELLFETITEEAVFELLQVTKGSYDKEKQLLSFQTADKSRDLHHVFAILAEKQVQLEDLFVKEPRLEDVYLDVIKKGA